MRKNKSINPGKPSPQNNEPKMKQIESAFGQNKIYFPSHFQGNLTPYKIQLSNQNNQNNGKHPIGKANNFLPYQIPKKHSKEKRSGFSRENKFQRPTFNQSILLPPEPSRDLVKYSTLQLKNLPNTISTASGTTIYRSKNIKSLNKLTLEFKIQRRNHSQIKRNISLRNEQSVEPCISKTKSQRQTILTKKDKNFLFYETYFTTKLGTRTNSFRLTQKTIQPEEKLVENPEDLLFRQIIAKELYLQTDSQQQFF